MTEIDDADETGAYAGKVGTRLRAIRRQKRLSLQDVEAASNQEFKASVLGAYERGERAISVPRLQRLARFYRVPVDQLLPGDDGPDFGPRPGDGDELLRCFGADFARFAKGSDVLHSLKDETIFVRVLGGIRSGEFARA